MFTNQGKQISNELLSPVLYVRTIVPSPVKYLIVTAKCVTGWCLNELMEKPFKRTF